jgi:arginase family enzyme
VCEFDNLGAFDVCEMIPQYDVGGGRTARYAAQAVLAVIGHRVLDSQQSFHRDTLDAVFR